MDLNFEVPYVPSVAWWVVITAYLVKHQGRLYLLPPFKQALSAKKKDVHNLQ